MSEGRLLLRLEKIDKSFPGVHALDQVDFDLYAGEVHVLLGENGAGKSTLVKIISGSLQKDSGKIFIDSHEIEMLDPEHSKALGIGMVYQELSLVPALSVAENIFLGQLPHTRLGLVDWSEVQDKARDSPAQLGVEINPQAEVRSHLVPGYPIVASSSLPFHRLTKILFSAEWEGCIKAGSSSTRWNASLLASTRIGATRRIWATLKSGNPDWRVPKNSPGLLRPRSSSAI